jgi:hypothetical protein
MDYGRFQQLASLQSGNINDYIKQLKTFLEEKAELVNKASSGGEVIVSMEVTDKYMLDLIDEFAKWSDVNSKQFIYNALFIKTNSFLEWGLIECCRLAAIYTNDSFIDYKKDKGIDKAKCYLQEKLNIPINIGKEWSRFKVNQDVRNMIVHNGANIVVDYTKEVKDQPLYKTVVNNKKVFYLSETGFVYIINMEYIQESHNLAIDFVQQTLDAVTNELRNRGVNWY